MFAFIINVILIAIIMKVFFRFMYPKPPKRFFPKDGDDTSLRTCRVCHNSLPTYRGVLMDGTNENKMLDDKGEPLFFCNYDHQAEFLGSAINTTATDINQK